MFRVGVESLKKLGTLLPSSVSVKNISPMFLVVPCCHVARVCPAAARGAAPGRPARAPRATAGTTPAATSAAPAARTPPARTPGHSRNIHTYVHRTCIWKR